MQQVCRKCRKYLVALFSVMCATTLIPFSQADSDLRRPGFKLLSLDDQTVKWGAPHLGESATIRYAFLTRPTERAHGKNCRSLLPFPVRFGKQGIGFAAIAAEFRAAFAAWERTAAIRFEEVANETEADLLIGAQSAPRGVAFADVVKTSISGSKISSIRSAAICLSPQQHWETNFDGNRETYDVRYVAMHEIGHVIGLDHVWGRTPRIMSVKYRETIRGPQSDDADGARLLYGPPLYHAAENTNVQPKTDK